MGILSSYRLKKEDHQDEDAQQTHTVTSASAPQGMPVFDQNSIPSRTSSGLHNAWIPHLIHDDNSSSEGIGSSEGSLFPDGDFRTGTPGSIKDIKCEVMVNWLHSKQEEKIWTTGEPGEGVVLRKSKGAYVCCPLELQHDESRFYQAVARLNVRVCLISTLPTFQSSNLIRLR